jgi:uncharacterized glyoxalase superfamily protein PhnB
MEMSGNVNPIPEGFHTLTPHIVVNDANQAIEFYKNAFGAEELCRMPGPGGKLMHAEIKIGDSIVMMCNEFPEQGAKSPQALNGSPVTLHLYVNNVDAAMKKAEDAGAKVTMPAMDAFWGDRYGRVQDPFGHNWSIATHKEDLTPEQIQQRADEFFSKGACGEG